MEPRTPQAYAAEIVWSKRQRIEILKTLVTATAVTNPDKAPDLVKDLLEEVAPFLKVEKEKKDAMMKDMLKEEQGKQYLVTYANVAPLKHRKLRGKNKRVPFKKKDK